MALSQSLRRGRHYGEGKREPRKSNPKEYDFGQLKKPVKSTILDGWMDVYMNNIEQRKSGRNEGEAVSIDKQVTTFYESALWSLGNPQGSFIWPSKFLDMTYSILLNQVHEFLLEYTIFSRWRFRFFTVHQNPARKPAEQPSKPSSSICILLITRPIRIYQKMNFPSNKEMQRKHNACKYPNTK